MSESQQPLLKVLVADCDLMSCESQWTSIYRRYFQSASNIHFSYFLDSERADHARPGNVSAIPGCKNVFQQTLVATESELRTQTLVLAERIAEVISSKAFDVLEIPDYRPELLMLPASLSRRGIGISRVVAAIHGRKSQSILSNWDNSPRSRHYGQLINDLEKLLYASADIRYGFQINNLDRPKTSSSLSTQYLSPLRLLDASKPAQKSLSQGLPNLYFIGRTERQNGPDLFLEMLWNLPRSNYAQAYIVGESVDTGMDKDSFSLLRAMAHARDLDVTFQTAMSQNQLQEIFASRSIVFAPSRPGGLNLVAIDALLAGCPAVISEGDGICGCLADELPALSFTRFDLNDPVLNAQRTSDLLEKYDTKREELRRNLPTAQLPRIGPEVAAIYRASSDSDAVAREKVREIYQEQYRTSQSLSRSPFKLCIRAMTARVSPQSVAQRMRENGLSWIVASYHINRSKLAANLPETSADELRHKISILENAVGGERFGRAWTWSALSKLEKKSGRDLVSATYAFRSWRLNGRAPVRELAEVTAIMQNYGFDQEARLVELMYGPSTPENRHLNLLTWLHEHRALHLVNPDTKYVRVDDRRGSRPPRVAIIVSLYNAASKTTHFLNAIHRQTLVRRGEVELILVDSGSPQDEYGPIVAHPCFTDYPSVYVRTEKRETIQQAWNRGLSLARAPYITLLGADESILPDCLERLSAELELRPDLDWIQANSLVTETDASGHFDRDVQFYDRHGYCPESVRLETCYLSYVGALYRRNIHDRFGYFDPTFKAAGDTEFKSRLLPDLKTDVYPRTLGVFWNYPELRTTQFPTSEIEDIRAWHVFRTSAGVEYSHRRSSPDEIVRSASQALRYRRSYASTDSSDLEYACTLLRYATQREPNCFPIEVLRKLESTLDDFRELDRAAWSNAGAMLWSCSRIFARMRRLNSRLAKIFSNRPDLKYFNDERCEHINWCWSYLT